MAVVLVVGLVMLFSACGEGKTETQTIGGRGAAETRAALSIFEQVGFRHLAVYSNLPAVEENFRKEPSLRHELRARHWKTKDFDCISTKGYASSFVMPLYACWMKATAPERSSRAIRRVLRDALKASQASDSEEFRDFDVHRLARIRVCNWTIISYDSGSDAHLHARLERAVSELRKRC